MMQTLNRSAAMRAAISIILSTWVTGCAEWNSAPVVVQQNFGHAVDNMIQHQTLYPEHGQDDSPILTLDGQKAQGAIGAYRKPAKEPIEESKTGVTFDVRQVGSD